ncbi:hypothetical protein LAZ40_21835 [Cereibacter sphaeroides]|uniref:hypothetical protein n=1 Tax=Cereibacter sphaeroides TaxID=1063 RepID=UPI001F293118|nr:hypothetical protein [Cereibacter sphaeroides]MCE6953222.1 hypothetical protein [Cereibacter sphaeroides]MCE6961677.1 hypothetical protein [Cereibacter sphaeroides]MCE6968062.1 hypothetical protein [Cereibacter sphaeroides]MCE6975027.1 hypothetical protein [Cereibacter sphaeroides]
MTGKRDQGTGQPVGQDELRDLGEELLRAIEAEPVPEPILELARRLAHALGVRSGAEPVGHPPHVAGERNDS